MNLNDVITVPMAKSHMDIYAKHRNAFSNASMSAKRKAFLEFVSNKEELKLIGNLPDYACYVHNWNLAPNDYKSIMRHFIYETLVSKTYNCLNKLGNIASNLEATFKNEFGDVYKYHMVKSLTKYYKTKIKIWGIDYQIDKSTSNPVNFKITSSDKLYDILDDFLNKFLNLSKQGEFVPDEVLLDNNIIKQEDYLKRFSQRFLNYRKMILENSANPNASAEVEDYFPNMIVLGVKSFVTFDDIPEEDKHMFEGFKLEEIDNEMLQAFDFYFIGMETLNIDACIRLDQLFK